MACDSESGNCNAWAARDPSGLLSPYKFNRRSCYSVLIICFSFILPYVSRSVQSGDVSLKITHCGVCYADVIWTRNMHNDSKYPLVPG
ncbi:hypothetical protein PR202_ga23064 [Eleusine coracana subsp. coracana]|uniref:Uncharacterized protein n=1 Tax=Eleusine coracana subsp. coracana TaxID=191504 RepID=A0AAV5D479_ELECO|nr:hypothetical protein PR202_ga23064 [Eleusine coracana subsp. coracana]